MDIQNTFWKLQALADCSVLDKQTREAVSESVKVLNDCRNLLNLGSEEDLSTITKVVYEKLEAIK